jgi:hypothetical protein
MIVLMWSPGKSQQKSRVILILLHSMMMRMQLISNQTILGV